MSWNLSDDDKLDFTDAKKTLEFFEQDLQHAYAYKHFLDGMIKRKFKVPPRFMQMALKDIDDAKHNLALIKKKLAIN